MLCIPAHMAKPLAALAGCDCLKGQGAGSASPYVIGFTSLDFCCTVLMLLQCLQTSASFSSQPGPAM